MVINKKLYDKITDITITGYEPLFENEKNVMLDDYSIETMFEDLLSEIDSLQEKYDDLEKDIQDNYRPISRSEYTGDSYDDRY